MYFIYIYIYIICILIILSIFILYSDYSKYIIIIPSSFLQKPPTYFSTNLSISKVCGKAWGEDSHGTQGQDDSFSG